MSTLQGSLISDEDGSAGEKSEPLLRVEVELQPKRSDHDLTITVCHLHCASYTYFHLLRVFNQSVGLCTVLGTSTLTPNGMRIVLESVLSEFISGVGCLGSSACYGMMRLFAIVI
jgi:hypothetical protein